MAEVQPTLSFRPIDLGTGLASAIDFRRDSFVCSFGDDSRFDEAAYVGFLQAKQFWGRGYMSEAASAVTDCAFEQLGFTELLLANAAGNLSSRRIKEKSGARFVGLAPGEYVDPSLTQQELWSLRKQAWQARRS